MYHRDDDTNLPTQKKKHFKKQPQLIKKAQKSMLPFPPSCGMLSE
jgi:hypothetical protein